MLLVADIEHHALYLRPDKGVHLTLRRTGLRLVEFVEGLEGDGLAEQDYLAAAHSEVVVVVVGGGKDEYFLLESAFLCRPERHARIPVGECPEEMVVLMAGLRENHDGVSFEKRFLSIAECVLIVAQGIFSLEIQPVGRE